MNVDVKKRVWKDAEKIPQYIKEIAANEIENLKTANNLSELGNVEHMEGTDEPYFRLKFNDYRFLMYYNEETKTLEIRKLKHRKDVYKKHNLPWR
jgi:mRNA-degrading endonuclease RelE of RelBE toxin-antitoxin system